MESVIWVAGTCLYVAPSTDNLHNKTMALFETTLDSVSRFRALVVWSLTERIYTKQNNRGAKLTWADSMADPWFRKGASWPMYAGETV